MPALQAILLDLDGTLVNSGLDFDQIRLEMGFPPGTPILETLLTLEPERARQCREILGRHELAGADRATLMPGVREFLACLDRRGVRRGVLTRNARPLVMSVLDRLQLEFDLVLTRDDGPLKPDPAAIWAACKQWDIPPARAAIIGDFRYDVEVGRRAGVLTVLYTAGRDMSGVDWAKDADRLLHSFHDADRLLFGENDAFASGRHVATTG